MIYDKLIEKLLSQHISISGAESASGGLVSYMLSRYPGISEIFKGSFVSYSNEYKNKILLVDDYYICKYTAASYSVLISMLDGVRKCIDSDIVFAITGCAGPSTYHNIEPGTMFIGIYYKGYNYLYKYNFNGDRINIQEQSMIKVFETIDVILSKEV